MQELDRILDGDNLLRPVPVDVIHHRRQGGRLAAPGDPGDENQSPFLQGDFAENRWEAEYLEIGNDVRNAPPALTCTSDALRSWAVCRINLKASRMGMGIPASRSGIRPPGTPLAPDRTEALLRR
jgi:hypothetical protein